MSRDLLKTIISVTILILAAVVAIKILSWAVRIVLPIAILVIAGYIVYRLVTGRRL